MEQAVAIRARLEIRRAVQDERLGCAARRANLETIRGKFLDYFSARAVREI